MDHKEHFVEEALPEHQDSILENDEDDTPLSHMDHKEVFENDDDDSPMHHMDHKEIYQSDTPTVPDHPMIEKGEFHGKNEDELNEIEESDEIYEDAPHVIPEKGEFYNEDIHHLPKDEWKASLHGHDEYTEKNRYDHFEEGDEGFGMEHHFEPHSDDIRSFMDGGPGTLKPKKFAKDDPRLHIPDGKATALHDHKIVSKEPVPTSEHLPKYG